MCNGHGCFCGGGSSGVVCGGGGGTCSSGTGGSDALPFARLRLHKLSGCSDCPPSGLCCNCCRPQRLVMLERNHSLYPRLNPCCCSSFNPQLAAVLLPERVLPPRSLDYESSSLHCLELQPCSKTPVARLYQYCCISLPVSCVRCDLLRYFQCTNRQAGCVILTPSCFFSSVPAFNFSK